MSIDSMALVLKTLVNLKARPRTAGGGMRISLLLGICVREVDDYQFTTIRGITRLCMASKKLRANDS